MKVLYSILIVLLATAGYIIGLNKWWEFLDPILSLPVYAGVIYIAILKFRARRNPGEPGVGEVYIVFQTTNKIVESVEAQISRKVDRTISSFDVLGVMDVKTPEDCKRMVSALHSELMEHIGKNIHLFYAGPPSIFFDVGRLIGMHHIPHNHLTVYMWGEGKYVPLPSLT